MKAREDRTIAFTIIGYGLFFILIAFMANFTTTTLSLASFGAIIIFAGIWKVETFEISHNILTKTNFMGLYNRKINLNNIVRYEKRSIDLTNLYYRNPFTIIRLFSKDNKYFVFRQISIITTNNRNMKIDERTINDDDFKNIYNKIKRYKSQQEG